MHCPKCNSLNLFIEERGTQTALICSDCGRWIKWLSKAELNYCKFIKKVVVNDKVDLSNISIDDLLNEIKRRFK